MASQVTLVGRPLRMFPIEVAGTHISTIWSAITDGSYMNNGGHIGISNLSTGNNDFCVWIGPLFTVEFTGSVGTHDAPSLDDIVDLNQGPVPNTDNRRELPQDPYGRYAVTEGLVTTPYTDGPQWNAAQLTYAREFIRKFGVRVPRNAMYEPLVAPTSTIYIVSNNDAQRQIGNIIT
jgi:hypothetical protein